MTIEKCVHIMSQNVKTIRNSKLSESRTWAIIVVVYQKLLEELLTKNFNYDELEKIHKLLNDVQMLLHIVHTDLENMELLVEKNRMKDVYQKNLEYEKLIQRLDCVEVYLDSNDDGEWLKEMCTGYTIHMNGDNLYIRSMYPDKLIDIYSKLSSLSHVKTVLKTKSTEEHIDENTLSHVIEGTATPWAYTYMLMFGDNVDYTEEKDIMVKDVLNVSRSLNLPVEYIFGTYVNIEENRV